MSELNLHGKHHHHHHCHHYHMCFCGYCFDCEKYVYWARPRPCQPWSQPYPYGPQYPYGPYWNTTVSGSLNTSSVRDSGLSMSCNHSH